MISRESEKPIVVFLLIVTIFLMVNVNPTLGMIYFAFTILYAIPFLAHSTKYDLVDIITDRTNIIFSAVIAFIILGGWLFFAKYVLIFLGVMPESVAAPTLYNTDVFKYLAAAAEIPVISADFFTRLAIYGVIIPIVETLFAMSFLVVFYAGLLKMRPIKWPENIVELRKMLWVCMLVGATMSLFHAAVRILYSLSPNSALFVDFLFFGLSALLVFVSPKVNKFFGSIDVRPVLLIPLFLHIFVNSGVLIYG